jgi:tRNA(fMet)-specific endonuclease VapC
MAYLIDSSVWIQMERNRQPVRKIRDLIPDESIAVAAITASELLVGVARADTKERRARRERFVERVLQVAPVEAFDLPVARVLAELVARMSGDGNLIGSHDLLIAATALAYGYGVLTHNVREFGRVPGLEVRTV